jgi:NAD(P)-dependent dehydrogenase (short-subunit alcohol dehydrogenase family)
LSLLKEQHGERLTVLPLDVTKESTIEAAAKAVSEQHARLDMLINTAGILHVDHLNVQPGV